MSDETVEREPLTWKVYTYTKFECQECWTVWVEHYPIQAKDAKCPCCDGGEHCVPIS